MGLGLCFCVGNWAGAKPKDNALVKKTDIAFVFTSISQTHQNGLYIAAQQGVDCHRRRYQVFDDDQRLLGQSGPLVPGEDALVRIGSGFKRGAVAVTVVTKDCDQIPASVRWLRLGKPSPDHGNGSQRAKLAPGIAAPDLSAGR